MSVHDIAKLGRMLAQFLALFFGCFARSAGRKLLAVYVRGLLSDVQRKNVEAMALNQKVAPRTLQRFLASIAWDEQMLRHRRQQLVTAEHDSPDAIGCIDETAGRCERFCASHSDAGRSWITFAKPRRNWARITSSAGGGAASTAICTWPSSARCSARECARNYHQVRM